MVKIYCPHEIKEMDMWYFTWILGVAFAVMFAAGCGLWFENELEQDQTDGTHQ